MHKWKCLLLLPFVLLLNGCISPAISNVKTETVDNNPTNYQTVSKTKVEIETEDELDDDLLNQTFKEVKITYYDSSSTVITTETTQTLQQAIDQNKRDSTLVIGDGRGTNIAYDADIGEETERRTYNVPFVVDLEGLIFQSEHDLYQAVRDQEPELSQSWEGERDSIVDEIIVKSKKQEYDYMPIYNIATKIWDNQYIPYYQVTEYNYKFDKSLQFISKKEYRED